MLSWLIESDKAFFELINGHWHNAWFNMLMPFWRDKRSWIPLYILIAAILFWKYQWKALPLFLLTGLVVLLGDQISSELFKKTIMRPRPCNDPTMQASLQLLVPCGSGYSFTSSHATNHFALAYLFIRFLIPILPKQKTVYKYLLISVLFLWAALVAYAQVYVGVHYPLDVFCGALLGTGIAALAYRVFRRLVFSSPQRHKEH